METFAVVLPRPRSHPQSAGLALWNTVSMTGGAEEPMAALRNAPPAALVSCHPYDEAIVRHLVAHAGRTDCAVVVDAGAVHGQLGLCVRLAVAS